MGKTNKLDKKVKPIVNMANCWRGARTATETWTGASTAATLKRLGMFCVRLKSIANALLVFYLSVFTDDRSLVIEFQTQHGYLYQLRRSVTPDCRIWYTRSRDEVVGDGTVKSFRWPLGLGGERGFFRVARMPLE